MILILKRDDLPQEHARRATDSLELEHSGLSPELIEKAELIVFVEGADVKFLKHFPEIQSKDNLDVLMSYITSTEPTTDEIKHFSKKRIRWKKTR